MPPQLPPLYPVFYLFLVLAFPQRWKRQQQMQLGFIQLFQPRPPPLFQSICLQSFFFPFRPLLSLSIPACPVFKVHFSSQFSDSSAVSSSATRGLVHTREEKNVCVTNNAASMHRILIQEEIQFYLKIVCFFFVLVLNVARNTNSCLCVRTCIQKGIITTVLDLFLYNNLSFLIDVCFLTDHQGLSQRLFEQKKYFYGILKKC